MARPPSHVELPCGLALGLTSGCSEASLNARAPVVTAGPACRSNEQRKAQSDGNVCWAFECLFHSVEGRQLNWCGGRATGATTHCIKLLRVAKGAANAEQDTDVEQHAYCPCIP
eukprot:11943933-Alexandrium_andersonii.AAC.1